MDHRVEIEAVKLVEIDGVIMCKTCTKLAHALCIICTLAADVGSRRHPILCLFDVIPPPILFLLMSAQVLTLHRNRRILFVFDVNQGHL